MHYREIDFRSAPLRLLCTISNNGIDELIEFSKKELFDGITAKEYAEYIYGALLVACQAYALGTVSDINEIEKSSHKKIDLYKYTEIESNDYTSVELINALANFFKHNEEWSNWPNNGTVRVLRYYGINENTEFPLASGIQIILGDSNDLHSLCSVLEGWRFSLFNIRV